MLKSIRSYRNNEGLVLEFIKLLAVLCSDSRVGMFHSEIEDACRLVLDQGLIEEVVLCVNCVQLPDTAALLSGVMWKSAIYGD